MRSKTALLGRFRKIAPKVSDGKTPSNEESKRTCFGWLGRVRFLLFGVALLAGPANAQQRADAVQPEASTAISARPLVHARTQMVASAHPQASEAGRAILRSGGNAIDAMVAVQLVLGLVEPQSSGLGGGSFLVYFDAGGQKLTTFDGRETAPAGVTPTLFLDENGKPLDFLPAVVGGRSVGVPGTVRLLFETHERYGVLDWKAVVQPAIALARDGFPVSPRLSALLAEDETLNRSPTLRATFFDDAGKPWPPGHVLKNEAYARTLEAIATQGPQGFYEGPVAQGIVDTVRGGIGLSGAPNPGTLSLDDLKTYRVKERPPVCQTYRLYAVCGMGPPSSGALAVGQILGLVEPYDLKSMGPASPDAWRIIADASRLAFADRGRYMADEDFVPMPTKGLLDKAYLGERSKLLSGVTALPKDAVKAGQPAFDHAGLEWGVDASLELPSTSHFVIVDKGGDVVSMTTTIENGFGSHLMTGGFILNNEMTDFSFETISEGRPVANAVAPGKRPRSSMAPTIVLRDGRPVIALGSPGGSRIIGYVAGALIAMLDWDMDAAAATALPHLVNRFGTFDLEKGTSAEALEPALKAMGFTTNVTDLNSGLHAIAMTPNGLEGGVDPRREGLALGD